MYTIKAGNDTTVTVRKSPSGGPVVILSIKEKDGHEVEAHLGVEDAEIVAASLKVTATVVAR